MCCSIWYVSWVTLLYWTKKLIIKKNLMTLIKNLDLSIDERPHSEIGVDTMYYDLYTIGSDLMVI